MKCRACGHTNLEGNKYCGACGMPMQPERRSSERRFIAWEPQQCRSCGYKNGAGNKFCGMCGTALQGDRRRAERRAVQTKSSGTPRVAVVTSATTPSEHVDDPNHSATTYLGAPSPSSQKPRGEWVRSSGSSFLGLEDEPVSDPEYLLTDEEPRSSGGVWRALIALVILGAVGYLVLKNWDSPTFAAALAQIQKHTQSASNPEPKPQQPPATDQPSISTDENTASADAEKQSQKPQLPDTQTPAQKESQPSAKESKPEDKSAIPPSNPEIAKKDGGTNEKASGIPEEDQIDATDATAAEKSDANAKKNPSPEVATKTPMPAQDLYERGQAYLSGHGAPQSCDQGVVYTRAAAQQGNPKAAVQMGALYATGRCVSQDRVQAYTWFNEALRNDPNNEYVERSRSTLWAQMTSEERQRAAR